MKNKLRNDIKFRFTFHAEELNKILARQHVLLFQGKKVAIETYRPLLHKMAPIPGTFNEYCLYSDRRRGVVAKYSLARHAFRHFFNAGVLTGMRHRAW